MVDTPHRACTTINRRYVELGAESEMNLLDDVRSAVLEKEAMGTPGLYTEAQRAAEDLLSPYLVEFHRRLAYDLFNTLIVGYYFGNWLCYESKLRRVRVEVGRLV